MCAATRKNHNRKELKAFEAFVGFRTAARKERVLAAAGDALCVGTSPFLVEATPVSTGLAKKRYPTPATKKVEEMLPGYGRKDRQLFCLFPRADLV